ncbi:hypothetical protein F8280_02720 [Micromonospora noduli]|uniref:hypothetical protein n=1 Tax=Micromonospora noduli TaxID=709876 RepID=UPI00124B8119|nr:hypothetical protein [Micromonospora noduli]KAB1928657.1 hypothetical protein F8280_02720 [Micromonospora noduli]
MRPLRIAETVVTPSSCVEWVAGAGALVWDRRSLRVLDPDLSVALAWEAASPDADPILAVGVAPDRSRFALVGPREVQIRGADGRVQWSAEHGVALSIGWPQPHCHLAGDGLVYMFVPDDSGDHVVVWDSAGGSEVGRHPLQTRKGEQHLLLSTRTLRPQTVMDYGIDMPQNSIRSAGGHGRWMTHDARLGVVRLWQLREPHTDEVEGQLALL